MSGRISHSDLRLSNWALPMWELPMVSRRSPAHHWQLPIGIAQLGSLKCEREISRSQLAAPNWERLIGKSHM